MQALKILVVDDDPVTRSLLMKRLSKAECVVETAESGVEAIRMISNTYFDVILTDLMMPGGVDGIGVLETAKENNIKTEVILITAHGSIDNAIVAMKKGANDYLQKPINFDELILRLSKIQNLKHLMKNASDLRVAMETTEQVSSETIQHLEMTVAELQERMLTIRKTLERRDLPPGERIRMALAG
ncbi:MAG: response regulator [Desulfatitalea sp.]|nr:response regulator [Desulfatitalea sp.]NNK00339.1 response regulator [Desulfatitalea sp.]